MLVKVSACYPRISLSFTIGNLIVDSMTTIVYSYVAALDPGYVINKEQSHGF